MEILAYVIKKILTLRPFGPLKNFGGLEPPLNIKIFQKYFHVVFLLGLDPFARIRAK